MTFQDLPEAEDLDPCHGLQLQLVFCARTACEGADGEDIIVSTMEGGERRDTVPLQFISNSLLFVMFRFSHICRCQPTTRRKEFLFQVQPQRDGMKKKKKDLSFIEREGRKERGEKKQRRKIQEEVQVGRRQHGRINDRAQSPTVLIIKWCLTHQSKCSLSDIIVSSLTYANLPLHNMRSQVEMSISP